MTRPRQNFVCQNFLIVPWNKKRYEENLSAPQIAGVVREVLRCVIKIMKSNVVDDDELFSHIADELVFFLRAQNKRLRGIIDSDFLQSLSSSFHLLFAVLLVKCGILIFHGKSHGCVNAQLLSKK